MSKSSRPLTELTQEERAQMVKLFEAYSFDFTLSRFFSKEMSLALYREELLEVYDFLENLLHKTASEEETE